PSLPDEYRIQMTSVITPLQLNPRGYTVLLGYFQDLNVFAGFDIQRHRTFSTGSPSVQIDIGALHQALQYGLSFQRKNNQEIAIGIRPDQLFTYIKNALLLHEHGSDTVLFDLLVKASECQTLSPEELEPLPQNRSTIVTTVNRLSRSSSFRQVVLNAYDSRCSVTRVQLKLVEAAHILPVAAEGSHDHCSNGIALSPTMHKAYDNGLIYLDTDFSMRLNEEKAAELQTVNLHAGLKQVAFFLNRKIHLPTDPAQRPNQDLIIEANRVRRIPGF
ncbi:MAG: HNH endonuclease, partial [Desulfuromonadales bacterium]|nr:HNH endonuclease [Desulfuromonadales bacterium]